MLNKELLLMTGSKEPTFPPDMWGQVSEVNASWLFTVNQGTGRFDGEYLTFYPVTVLDKDGASIAEEYAIETWLENYLGMYFYGCPSDPFIQDPVSCSTMTFRVSLPSENEVFATYSVKNVYVQPSNWEVFAWKVKSNELLFTIKNKTGIASPENYVVIIDLQV